MTLATNLGFPRIGVQRELKKAAESYWKGESGADDLLRTAKLLRQKHWLLQKQAGLDHIPSNDFTLYDHVLDTACLLGIVPERYGWTGGPVSLDTYFAMARGSDAVPALEMTKWFDTNYHYIVPELEDGQTFALSSSRPFDDIEEAQALGITPRPVLLGPVSFLYLSKKRKDSPGDFHRTLLLPGLLAVYEDILRKFAAQGVEWVQIDEPCLCLDLDPHFLASFKPAFDRLRAAAPRLKFLLAAYFDDLGDNLDLALSLPVDALHLDLVRAPHQLDRALEQCPAAMTLSLGVVDGRNIWKNDLSASLSLLERAKAKLGADRLMVAPSCSLLHSPIDLAAETAMDPEIRGWMAFALQKLDEIVTLKNALNGNRDEAAFAASDRAAAERRTSPRIHNKSVKARAAAVTPDMLKRKSPFSARRAAQQDALRLPLFPTTSIGSFPQTPEIRKARADHKKGALDTAAYEQLMKAEIARVVKFQEEIGIDVLVHGEAERNDMVEYFGEQMDGYVFSQNGWVQSYGSRCVKPPIIYGDISRPRPMTVAWSSYAQSLTDRPMKGMLTGPVTILQWSFVRNDQPRSETCKQIALCIRDEVADLEKAGIRVIQIDEPAIREGLPLRRADWPAYLRWAVDCFRLASSPVADGTQIHTHMCYSEFNDIIGAIGEMDADVISIETSRSHMELLDAFVDYKYPNEIGPGVYDIHSPRVPDEAEMRALLETAADVLTPQQIWVNPDCGLKTRHWDEVAPALRNMVEAAHDMREKLTRAA